MSFKRQALGMRKNLKTLTLVILLVGHENMVRMKIRRDAEILFNFGSDCLCGERYTAGPPKTVICCVITDSETHLKSDCLHKGSLQVSAQELADASLAETNAYLSAPR